jgi:hypothetical protein
LDRKIKSHGGLYKPKIKGNVMCPYYNTDNKKCAFFDTAQDDSTRESKCLSGSNWRSCVNYSNRSLDEKVNKRLRPNPDL